MAFLALARSSLRADSALAPGAHDRAGHTDKGILELLVVADLSLFYLFIKPTHGIPPGLQKQVLKASRVYSLVTRDA